MESMHEPVPNEVICTERCYGPYDSRWPDQSRIIEEGETFTTHYELDNLPRYIVPVSEADEPEVEEEEVAAPMTLADAGGHDYRILQALQSLDPDNDTHWTANGLPQVDAVNAAIGSGSKVSRAQIHNCKPDFYRPA